MPTTHRLPSTLLLSALLMGGVASEPPPTAAAQTTAPADASTPRTVHGRLRYYLGTPTARIWIVGTKRILGVAESGDGSSTLPKNLRDLMSWERDLFADFIVEPLTPSRPGVMQMVRVLSASKIVVTEKGQVISVDRLPNP
jgi:hypothetical protein